MNESIGPKESSLREAYDLVEATTPMELSNLYSDENQKLMKSGEWDYKNKALITNRIKEILENVDTTTLSI